jgi:WD40 repeat protein
MGLIDNRIDQPHTTLQHTAEVAAIALAADGRILASACAGRNSVVTVWDVQRETIKRVMVPDYWAPLMAISPDGCYLAQAGESGTVKVWDIRSGTHRIFDVDNAASIRSLAISLDGGLVVAGTDQGWVGLADLGRPYPSSHAGQAWIRWQRCHHDGPVTSLEFALDGQSVFSGGEDGQIIQIDASGRKLASIVPQAGTRVISIVPLPTHGSLIVTRASGLGYEVAPQAIAP